MALPIGYSWRNLLVRRASTLFTALGIALTVAVFCGVFSLRNGFEQLYRPRGSLDLALYLRPGATSEGESGITREQANILLKERPEILRDAAGEPMAAAETYLAVYMRKLDGGLTNVPLRGVQPMSFRVHEEPPRIVEGRMLQWGADEVIVGAPLTGRMQGCRVGETLTLNLTPFRVVGVFEAPGAYGGEVWGDVERMMEALERPVFQRVIARIDPAVIGREAATALAAREAESASTNAQLEAKAAAENEERVREGLEPVPFEAETFVPYPTPIEELDWQLRQDPRAPLSIVSERAYLAKQTTFLSGGLLFLAIFLTLVMGVAAILGAMNTMIASVAARVHEVGVLRAIGYRPGQIFWAFTLESALIGVVGGVLGLCLVAPFHGVETGATNWNTFTDVSFSFALSPRIAIAAFSIAFVLGLIGGALPALRAASLQPVDALRIR
jgi:ABC-type lipoprotein release transport system permease subunit